MKLSSQQYEKITLLHSVLILLMIASLIYASSDVPVDSQPPTSTSTSASDSLPRSSVEKHQPMVESYFQGQIQHIQTEAEQRNIDLGSCRPTTEELNGAIESGDLYSNPSKLALAKIESCYRLLGLDFFRPVEK
ncbi:MAG: hypothetical protein VX278_09440 [Myxococcota bacterium]|nr:hypothetical protein [Myxococcota bacterium]